MIEIMDKLTILDADAMPSAYSLPLGTNAIGAVRDLIVGAGEEPGILEESDAELRGNVVWEAGTTRLRIINDILDAAGYFSLYCDPLGNYRADTYTEPARRPMVWAFADDVDSIYSPVFEEEQDLFSIPNRVVATSTADGETPALVASVDNIDPDDPFSIPARGRVLSHVEADVEITSQVALQAYVERRLRELSGANATVQLSHAFVPLSLNDLIELRSGSAFKNSRYVVQRMEIPFDPLQLMVSGLREVDRA